MKLTLSTTILSLVAAASLTSAAPARLDTGADISLEKRGYNGKATWYTRKFLRAFGFRIGRGSLISLSTFAENGQPGACGTYSSDNDHVVALGSSNYAGGSACHRTIRITNTGEFPLCLSCFVRQQRLTGPFER